MRVPFEGSKWIYHAPESLKSRWGDADGEIFYVKKTSSSGMVKVESLKGFPWGSTEKPIEGIFDKDRFGEGKKFSPLVEEKEADVRRPEPGDVWIYDIGGILKDKEAHIKEVNGDMVILAWPHLHEEAEWPMYYFEGEAPHFKLLNSKETTVRTKKVNRWTLAEKVIPETRLVLLYGPPGTGKTTAGNRIGLKGGKIVNEEKQNDGLLVSGTLQPVFNIFNITLTEETPAAELRGHYHMKGGDFVWQDGIGLMPFRKGGRLVLNEIDKASGDCLQFCHALLDDPDIAAITLPTGETVRPHSDFSVVATMNGIPEDLPEALRDRFSVRININNPHPKAIKSLPEDLQAVAKKSFSEKTEERRVSFRAWKMFAELREALGEEMAAAAVFDHRADTILNTIKIERSTSSKTTFVAAPPAACDSDLYEYKEFIDEPEDRDYDEPYYRDEEY